MVNFTTTLEWTGCALGLLGAAMLAFNFRYSRYGWFAFLGANIAMISFALLIDKHGLLVSQIGFACTSLLGIWRSGFISEPESTGKVSAAETTPPMITDANATPTANRNAPIGQTMDTPMSGSASRVSHPRGPHVIHQTPGDAARTPHGNT